MVPFRQTLSGGPERTWQAGRAVALGLMLAGLVALRPAPGQETAREAPIRETEYGARTTSPSLVRDILEGAYRAAPPDYRPHLRRADTLTSDVLRQAPPLAPPGEPFVRDAATSPAATATTATAAGTALATIDYATLATKLRLDRAFFSPTLVDDQRWDRRYRQATGAYQMAHGLQVDGIAGPETSASLGRLDPLTTTVVVRAKDFAALRPVPRDKDYLAMSELDMLGHRDLREALAERFHTTERFLSRLNPHLDWSALAPGDAVTVPNVRRRRPPFYAARVEVNVVERHVRVFDEEGRMRAHFNCSIGTDADVYARLQLEVINTVEWPNYTLDPRLFGLAHRISGRLLLAHGPNNPVGRAWVGLSRSGYGIHGTPDPEDIGQTRSLGCIRLANWDALSFAHMVRVGTPVLFLGQWRPAPPSETDGEQAPPAEEGEGPDGEGVDGEGVDEGEDADGDRVDEGEDADGDGGDDRDAWRVLDIDETGDLRDAF